MGAFARRPTGVGVMQGAPYGFQVGCLPLILRQSGLSFSSLGAMKLLFLPWILKPLYATVIESTK